MPLSNQPIGSSQAAATAAAQAPRPAGADDNRVSAASVSASRFADQPHGSLPLSLTEISGGGGGGTVADGPGLALSGDEQAVLLRDLAEVREEAQAQAPGTGVDGAGDVHSVGTGGRTTETSAARTTLMEEWLVREANQSETGAAASLFDRQALSASAGLETLSQLLREAEGDGRPALNRTFTDRAEQLLRHAAETRPAATLAADGSAAGDPGWLAAELDRPREFTRALASQDHKAGARLQHEAMSTYLGDKKAPDAQKRAARETFLRQVDACLDGAPGAEALTLTGADNSPAGVLKPDQKVALLVARSLERSLQGAGGHDREAVSGKSPLKEMTDPAKVEKRQAQNLKQRLRTSFEPVEKSFTHAGRDYLSEISPDLSRDSGHNTAVLCSDTHSPRRVPNMWHSRFQDAAGKTLFSGTRCGSLCAFGIRPANLKRLPRQELHDLIRTTLPRQSEQLGLERCAKYLTSRFSIQGFRLRRAARFQANRNRAQDLVRFHLQNNAGLMAEIAGSGAQTPRVKMTLPSINLITPDYARAAAATALNLGEDYNELRMTRDQDRALRQLAKEDVPVTVKQQDGTEKTVKVQLLPLTFSTGVNDLALGKAKRRLMGSWRAAEQLNRPAIRQLLGQDFKPGAAPVSGLVAEHLRALEDAGQGHGAEANTIRQLADQVGSIWQARGHHAENNDPYALPARLALLTDKMGMSPQYNCKSGKDRTGQLDAEIKFLATRMELAGGVVPQPGAPLSDEERRLFSTILLRSGNHEVQKMNTGSPGYKVKLDSISRRMDSMMSRLQHLGSGKFVSA